MMNNVETDGPHEDVLSQDNLEQVEMDMEESDQETESGKNDASNLSYHDEPQLAGGDKDHMFPDDDDRYSNSRFRTNIIQVTNIAPAATLEQMSTMFGMLGNIQNISLYHYNNSHEYNFKVCFVEFSKQNSVSMAQHLTNTVFIDRAIIVLPYNKHEIPDKDTAFSDGALEFITMFNHGVVSQVTTGPGGVQMIATADPRLTASGLSPYPHLPLNTEPSRIEEIRRTLYIGNLDSTVPSDQVMKFFNDIGEVKYIRIAGDETQPTRFAFVEYTHQSSVANALQQNGYVLGSRALKINHSNNSIVKPQPRIEIDLTVKKVRENRSTSRDYGSRDRAYRSSRADRDRERGSSRYHDSSRSSRSRRSRSRDNISRSRRSRSRDYSSRRSSSRDRSSRRRRKSRESKRHRSRSRSEERHSRRNKSRR